MYLLVIELVLAPLKRGSLDNVLSDVASSKSTILFGPGSRRAHANTVLSHERTGSFEGVVRADIAIGVPTAFSL